MIWRCVSGVPVLPLVRRRREEAAPAEAQRRGAEAQRPARRTGVGALGRCGFQVWVAGARRSVAQGPLRHLPLYRRSRLGAGPAQPSKSARAASRSNPSLEGMRLRRSGRIPGRSSSGPNTERPPSRGRACPARSEGLASAADLKAFALGFCPDVRSWGARNSARKRSLRARIWTGAFVRSSSDAGTHTLESTSGGRSRSGRARAEGLAAPDISFSAKIRARSAASRLIPRCGRLCFQRMFEQSHRTRGLGISVGSMNSAEAGGRIRDSSRARRRTHP